MFDEQFPIGMLSEIGDPLAMVSKVIGFEMFRPTLEDKLLNSDKKDNAGAKPFDVVTMFKIIAPQRYYGLSDKQVGYQIIDRASFKKSLGLGTGDKAPDEKTVWAFGENLTRTGHVGEVFGQFKKYLEPKGLMFNEGQLVDASFTVAPRQRNAREGNEKIKNGEGDGLWDDSPNKKCHKDIDARWAKKNNEVFYGYKNHAKVDSKSKSINTYPVTDASVHDSQALDGLLDTNDEGQPLYADSAYTGGDQEKTIPTFKMGDNAHEKGYRNKPLTDEQKAANNKKSKTRARVGHVFGFMEQSMNGPLLRSVGMVRATATIGLINLTYNPFRYEQVVRLSILNTGQPVG